MHTLFLDFSSGTKSIGLILPNSTAVLRPIDDHTNEAGLMDTLLALLKAHNASLTDLHRIAVTVGPGGFMSIRVGIALANALSWSLKIPLAGIHLSDLWEVRTQTSDLKPQTFLWLHSTKKESFFIRGFGELESKWPEPILISLYELLSRLSPQASYLFIGELLQDQRTALPMLTEKTDARSIEDILPSLLESLTYEQKTLEPWYGRGA